MTGGGACAVLVPCTLCDRRLRHPTPLPARHVIVVYGSICLIAERSSEKLRQMGKQVKALSEDAVNNLRSYEACVIGSAIHYGSCMKEATECVHLNQVVLTS